MLSFRYIIATQFEHIRARAVFPCFDEPIYKTPYILNLVHPSDMVALANTPVESFVDIGAGWTRTTFIPVAPVSSYLVAMAVGDLIHKDAVDANGVQVRVWERPGFEAELDMALYTAVKTVEHFAQYLDEPYPLPKLGKLSAALAHALNRRHSWPATVQGGWHGEFRPHYDAITHHSLQQPNGDDQLQRAGGQRWLG